MQQQKRLRNTISGAIDYSSFLWWDVEGISNITPYKVINLSYHVCYDIGNGVMLSSKTHHQPYH